MQILQKQFRTDCPGAVSSTWGKDLWFDECIASPSAASPGTVNVSPRCQLRCVPPRQGVSDVSTLPEVHGNDEGLCCPWRFLQILKASDVERSTTPRVEAQQEPTGAHHAAEVRSKTCQDWAVLL